MAFHRRALPCDICGQQFFPSSLPFHMKQCLVKQKFVEVPCQFCDQAVRNCDMDRHLAKGCGSKIAQSRVARPDSAGSVAGIRPCAVCGRRFASDRLVKHQTICRKNAQKEKERLCHSNSNSPPPVKANDAQAINSTWRDKRDEMKREMKNSRNRTAIDFELVLKSPHEPDEIVPEQPTPINGAMVIIQNDDETLHQSELLDDSLEAIDYVQERIPVDLLDLSQSPQLQTPSTSVSEIDSKPSAWTIEWNSNGYSAVKPKLPVMKTKQPSRPVDHMDLSQSSKIQTPSTSVSESDSKPSAWTVEWNPEGSSAVVKPKLPVMKPKQPSRWVETGSYKGMSISESFYAPQLDLTSRLPPLPTFSQSSRIRFN